MDKFELADEFKKPERPFKVPGGSEDCYNERIFKWTIKDASKFIQKKGERKISPNFEIEFKSKWHAEIGRSEEKFYLFVINDECESNKEGIFNLSIEDSAGKVLYKNSGRLNITYREKKQDIIDENIEKCMDVLLKAPDDKLIFHAFIEVNCRIWDLASMFCLPPDLLDLLPLNVKNMMTNSFIRETDMAVVDIDAVNVTSYFAGKNAVTSRVKEEWYRVKELESKMNSFMLKHVDFDTTLALYRIAERYSMLDLKQKCKQSMLSMITEDNI